MTIVSLEELLEVGAHFGHRTQRCHPKMQPYILTERKGIHIIDLRQTLATLEEAHDLIQDTVAEGGTVLFVGTKRQAQATIEREAKRCGMAYVNMRWLGGTLTNWQTIRQRIDHLCSLEAQQERGDLDLLPKKEALDKRRKIENLNQKIGGIKQMRELPSLLFVVDIQQEATAVAEADTLGIPIIAIVDTDCNPDPIDYVIPANDDAIRSIRLITSTIAGAVLEGIACRKTHRLEEISSEGEDIEDERYLSAATLARLRRLSHQGDSERVDKYHMDLSDASIGVIGDNAEIQGGIHFGSLNATRIFRYSDVSFPSYASLQQTEALRVAITIEPTSDQVAELALEPPSNEDEPMKVDACVIVSPLDFDLGSANVQTIEVPLDDDSAPVIFKLVPNSVGRKTIVVEFFQDTRYLGRAEVETTVGKKSRESHPIFAHSALALRSQQLAPDLTIYIEEVSLEKKHRLYRFLLLSPIHELNLNFEESGEIELQAPPEVYFEELFVELNDWLRERDVDDDLFFKRLSSLGANLYDQLFPEKLKRIYWEKLRDKVDTVQIISADPWIPWELVRPYHPDTLEEDGFLCEQFALTRWLAGSSSPDVIDFQKLALVVAASDPSAVVDEAEALRKLPNVEVRDVPPSLLDVYELLETGGFNGLHFACHGKYDPKNPDQSSVFLSHGQRFRPNDIAGKKRAFGRDEPLIFLNACETGRAGFSLTGLGGWAKAFLSAGVGGFIGSSWEAHDESAYRFAVAFYDYLLEGETVAEAARLARRKIRRAGDPTWLSYTVYANPLARLESSSSSEDLIDSS